MSGLFNAISEALAPASSTQSTNTTTNTSSNKPPVDSIHPVVPPTAQTSEFVNAGSTSPKPNYATGPGFGGSPVFSGGGSAGFGGGLASNPNVPRPGASINPETGKPHTAGLTRAELQAMREKGADLLDSSPQTEVARRGSKDGVSPELSGREQAAAQLANTTASTGTPASTVAQPTTAHLTSTTAIMPTGTSLPAAVIAQPPQSSASTHSNVPGVITPGLEMPGAWGPVPTAPVPGSTPNAPTSVYEDVATGLEKVGLAAYNIIPQSLKEVISPNVNTSAPTSPSQAKTVPRSPTLAPSSPNAGRRGSLFDQAKAQTNTLLTQAQQTVQQARKSSVAAQGEGLIKDVRGFLGDVVAHTPFVGEPLDSKPKATTGTKTSLPSQEPLGAQPGDKTAGVGALPGKLSEQGVAVLPDEKKQSVRENQSSLPGENSAFGSYSISSGAAGPSGSSGSHAVEAVSPPPAASTVPEPAPHHSETSTKDLEPASTPSVDLLAMPATALALETLPEPASSQSTTTESAPAQSKFVESLPEANPSTNSFANTSTAAPSTTESTFAPSKNSSSHGSYAGLAAPLPATFLGTGAAHGATDLETLKGISTESAHPADANGTGLNPSSDVSASATSKLSPIAPSNDRTTSLASVTAIRHGHEGERSSSDLAKQAIGASALASVAEGQKSTTRGTGPEHTTSLTPGNVEDGVGHPSSRSTDVAPTSTSTSTSTPQVGVAPTTGTSAEPAKPAVRDEQQPTTNNHQSSGEHAKYPMEGHDQPKSNVFGTGKDTTGHEILKHDGVAVPEPASTSSPISPVSSGHHGVKDEVSGHHRTGSSSSVGADGKRKSGFLGKLKEKLHHH